MTCAGRSALLWLCLLSLGLGLPGGGCAKLSPAANPILAAAEPSRTNPVTAAMQPDPPYVRPGETFQLLVRVRIAGGHHIYGTNASPAPFSPTTLTLILPEDLQPAGDWIAPRPTVTKTGAGIYTDSVLFRRPLKVRSNAPLGELSIKGDILCQACTDELCWPAGKIALSASVAVVPKPKE